jgi:transcriptional/translational regulatory protein YebC/TACO1
VSEDDLMAVAIDAGADDIVDEGDNWRVVCAPTNLPAVRDALDAAGIAYDSADVTMLASTTVELDNADAAKAVLRLIEALEDNDDISDVYANFDISEAILESIDV